jgi:hypothetical protein
MLIFLFEFMLNLSEIKIIKFENEKNEFFRLTAVRKTGWVPNKVTPSPVSPTTTPDPVTVERNVNPRFWMDERTVDTLSQKLTVPLQLQLDSVSDGLKEEYRNLLGSLRDDLYNLKMETAGFHGTLDQRLVNALRTLFNEVPDESVNNTTHTITWTTPRTHQVLLSTGLSQAFGFD